MKLNYRTILSVILIAGLFIACRKEESCPEVTDLGQLSWSKETENWFPVKYINHPETLSFVSEHGDTLEFISREPKIYDGFFETFVKDCENGEGSTRVRWADKRFGGGFLSKDSLEITIGMGVWNEKLASNHVIEADFYDWIGIILSRKQNPGSNLGYIRIVTDLKNSELEEIDHSPNDFEKLENIEYMGNQYSALFTDKNPDFENSNIYFAKGQGLIGFKDENGIKWKLLE